MHQPTCTIAGCDKPSRNSTSRAMCPMHYHRWYRHKRTDLIGNKTSMRINASKYRLITLRDHPIATPSGRSYEHRFVLYEEIGPGWHSCHWCSRPVTWDQRTGPDALEVDHLNEVRDDNRIENLVASCGRCNGARSAQARHERLVEAGFWSGNDTVAKTGRSRPVISPMR